MKQEITIYFGLIAAIIGASAVLLGQYTASFLTTRRECKKIKRELLAEERCLAYLLSEYYSVFIDEMSLSAFYLRLADISFNNQMENEDLYKSANEALDRAQDVEEKIRLTTANYLKVITHFTNLTGKRNVIIGMFDQLTTFQKPNVSKFSEINNITEFHEAKEKEVSRLKELYRFFPQTYDRIFEEMKKMV